MKQLDSKHCSKLKDLHVTLLYLDGHIGRLTVDTLSEVGGCFTATKGSDVYRMTDVKKAFVDFDDLPDYDEDDGK